MDESSLKQNCGLNMKIMSFKNKYHLSVFYLMCHISISLVALFYLTNKDENKKSAKHYVVHDY